MTELGKGEPPTRDELLAAARADPGWEDFLDKAHTPHAARQCADDVRQGLYAQRRLVEAASMERLDYFIPENELGDDQSRDKGRFTRYSAERAATRELTIRGLLFSSRRRTQRYCRFSFRMGRNGRRAR